MVSWAAETELVILLIGSREDVFTDRLVEMFSMEEALRRAMTRMANKPPRGCGMANKPLHGCGMDLFTEWHLQRQTLHSSLGVLNLGCRGPLLRKPRVLFCRLGNPIVFLPSTSVG